MGSTTTVRIPSPKIHTVTHTVGKQSSHKEELVGNSQEMLKLEGNAGGAEVLVRPCSDLVTPSKLSDPIASGQLKDVNTPKTQ